jgi:hypothetical protein
VDSAENCRKLLRSEERIAYRHRASQAFPAKSKPPSGLIQTEAHIRRGTSGLVVIGHPLRGVPAQQ